MIALAGVAEPLVELDEAAASGLVVVDDRSDWTWLAFTRPLARAAFCAAIPRGRRSTLHAAAALAAPTVDAALYHRVEAATGPDAQQAQRKRGRSA